ncbi:MAG: hypothetical protein OXQ94_05720 [Gemmatimonadota bacterium]|nr:hypothetical protein [Gemmatimonadota bacterium]MDE2871169.1 hypothetical protein [Gemmatimonadota bacterium]
MTRSNGRLVRGTLLAFSLVLLAGCGDDPVVEEDPKLTGEWTGQAELTIPGFGSVPVMVTLGLSENDAGMVTGTMTWNAVGQTGTSPVTGTHKYPDVSLNLSVTLAGTEVKGKYEGKLTTDDRMEGTFSSEDGSITGPLALTRKAAT